MHKEKKAMEGEKRDSSVSSSDREQVVKEKPSLLDKGKAALHMYRAKKNLETKRGSSSSPSSSSYEGKV